MLDASSIVTKYDKELVELGALIVRNVKEKTDNGVVIDVPELQFQVTNVSSGNLKHLDAKVNYYDKDRLFVGTEWELRNEILANNGVHTFALYIEPPKLVSTAELIIEVKRHSFSDTFGKFISHPIFIAAILGLFIYVNFKK